MLTMFGTSATGLLFEPCWPRESIEQVISPFTLQQTVWAGFRFSGCDRAGHRPKWVAPGGAMVKDFVTAPYHHHTSCVRIAGGHRNFHLRLATTQI
jgi:hypothetical protein